MRTAVDFRRQFMPILQVIEHACRAIEGDGCTRFAAEVDQKRCDAERLSVRQALNVCRDEIGEGLLGESAGHRDDGDIIEIDIPSRSIRLAVTADVIAAREEREIAGEAEAYRPKARKRKVSTALKAYAAFTTSAAKGAVREVDRH